MPARLIRTCATVRICKPPFMNRLSRLGPRATSGQGMIVLVLPSIVTTFPATDSAAVRKEIAIHEQQRKAAGRLREDEIRQSRFRSRLSARRGKIVHGPKEGSARR